MRLAGLTVLLVAGLTLSATVSAARPKWTATGPVKKLSARSITVQGTTCRITKASPPRSVLRLYYVGAKAKIACGKGVLDAIASAGSTTGITVTGEAHCSASTSTLSANSSVSLSHTNGCTFTLDVLSGRFSVLNFTGASVLAGASTITLMCTIGADSPDTGALVAGAQLSQLTCRNGFLTGFTGG